MRVLTIAALLAVLPAAAGAQERLADQLRKGIVQEEASGSVDKAIPIYQAIVAQFDQDRQAAATAVFRLGECYRKAGKKEQAVTAYQRVVREFADQAALAESSRKQLQAYGVAETPGARESAEVAQLRKQIAEFRKQEEAARAGWTSERADAPAEVGPSGRTQVELMRLNISSLERQLADVHKRVQAGLVPQSDLEPLQHRYQELITEYQGLIEQRARSQKLAQETMKSLEAEILIVEKRIADIETRVSVGAASVTDPELTQLRRDLLALQRKLAEVRASVQR